MISATNITMQYPIPKRYVEYLTQPFQTNYFKALKKINIEIQSGDRIAFLGVNGAGKTTFLKIIGGLLYPSSGSLCINGIDTQKQNLKARKRVGFVLNEERSFYWRLTGKKNLLFFGALDNIKGEELHKKVEELLRMVGLEDSKDKIFAGYSSGMKQRLAIARGLLSNPDILILDEPTRTLDPLSAEVIGTIISERIHNKKERTLLIATHSLSEAQILCNKICFMKKGQIIDYSSIKSIISEYGTLENYYKKMMNDEMVLDKVQQKIVLQ
ncbi:ABC transporter ATP-binding protein [Snuella sedimenti]|uniref:ABC transporter ATP-binding protein n=1 Tax=Snuella sedimenti TaxID=2798802 RepID=A0A8J7LUM3_9FLAO|nr:ABC transporter ATP-binding protein [Snuella sedimenti]MBJ6369816.1 ABC transporter ATP-binding protein [Snuella sedimenti]